MSILYVLTVHSSPDSPFRVRQRARLTVTVSRFKLCIGEECDVIIEVKITTDLYYMEVVDAFEY
jgi:hypothetical protein